MKHLIVATDFSKASRSACEYATMLAQDFNAKITLIHVFAPQLVIDDISAASLLVTHDELLERYQVLLQNEIKILSEKFHIKIDSIVREGFADDMIPKIALKRNAELIILGMKGKGKSNSLFGSIASSVIRKSSLPVLLIPENATYLPIKNIALATDFNSNSEINGDSLLFEIAQKYDSLISIFNVQSKESKLKMQEVIGKMKINLDLSKLKHFFYTISDTNVIHGIGGFIKQNPTDILAMIAHRHNFLERVFKVVHTKEMTYHTEIPLLIFHGY